MFCPLLHAIPVRILAWDDQIAGMKIALRDSKGSIVVERMHPTQRTSIYQVGTGETPPAIELLDKKGPDGKPLQVPLILPEGIKKPLVLILPDAKAPAGVRPAVMEDDESGFAWGAVRFINATGKQLVFVHENKGTNLAPSWNPVTVQPGGESRSMGVKLFFREQPERAVYSAIWEQQPEVRMLVFLVPGTDPRLGPVGTKMISEDRRVILLEQQAKGARPGDDG